MQRMRQNASRQAVLGLLLCLQYSELRAPLKLLEKSGDRLSFQ